MWGGERKGETYRQTERARPDGMPYIANNSEARGPIMHTERVSFINYPEGFFLSLLYAHTDTFLHFIIFVGGCIVSFFSLIDNSDEMHHILSA